MWNHTNAGFGVRVNPGYGNTLLLALGCVMAMEKVKAESTWPQNQTCVRKSVFLRAAEPSAAQICTEGEISVNWELCMK